PKEVLVGFASESGGVVSQSYQPLRVVGFPSRDGSAAWVVILEFESTRNRHAADGRLTVNRSIPGANSMYPSKLLPNHRRMHVGPESYRSKPRVWIARLRSAFRLGARPEPDPEALILDTDTGKVRATYRVDSGVRIGMLNSDRYYLGDRFLAVGGPDRLL